MPEYHYAPSPHQGSRGLQYGYTVHFSLVKAAQVQELCIMGKYIFNRHLPDLNVIYPNQTLIDVRPHSDEDARTLHNRPLC